jgi:hypothetical protein
MQQKIPEVQGHLPCGAVGEREGQKGDQAKADCR